MDKVDKRRRNARPSRYRPRTEAQKQRRKDLWSARETERKQGRRRSEEDDLRARLDDLETALRDQGRLGVHNRRHVRPLNDIEDDAQRFAVLKARVERLEALWAINQRKRQTRGKIIIGGALIAEIADHFVEDREDLLQRLVDIIDRRVDAVFDRLTVRDLLGDVPLPLAPGTSLEDALTSAVGENSNGLPDFDAMAESAMVEELDFADDDTAAPAPFSCSAGVAG